MDQIKEVMLTEQQIQEKVLELAQQISKDYEGKNPIFVGVLKGVVVFYADMIRALTVPCQLDFMWISSYKGTESSGMQIRQDLSNDIKGRHVLILEDIFDTGRSLDFTVKRLMEREPASLKICTLLDKPERRDPTVTLKADWVGFTVPNEFVVGYGLDYNEHYRNLPYIGILKPEIYE